MGWCTSEERGRRVQHTSQGVYAVSALTKSHEKRVPILVWMNRNQKFMNHADNKVGSPSHFDFQGAVFRRLTNYPPSAKIFLSILFQIIGFFAIIGIYVTPIFGGQSSKNSSDSWSSSKSKDFVAQQTYIVTFAQCRSRFDFQTYVRLVNRILKQTVWS